MKILKNPLFSKTQLLFLITLATITFITKLLVSFHPSYILPRDDGLYYLFLSENLRLVYPDHTPMVAYFLAFARFLFNILMPGTFEDYLPASLPLISLSSTVYFLFLYSFLYFFIAKVWKNKALAILILFAFLLTPYLWGVSFLTTPETPLTFFAFPAVLLFAHAFLKQPENLKVWLLAGFFLAGAFLGKILAIPLGVAIALYAVVSPNRKRHLTNFRLYLAFVPSLLAGLIVLYADYLGNFTMIRFLFLRSNIDTNINTISRFFFNQFIYFSPLFFFLILFSPALQVYQYTRNNILPSSFKIKLTPPSKYNYKTENAKQQQDLFYKELLFYLAVLSTFCMAFLFYQLLTTRMLNWWGGFTAAPNLFFICLWLQKKLSSTTTRRLQKLIVANFMLTGVFCIFASFHSVYGVVDENYNRANKNISQPTNDTFPAYNTTLNKFAFFIKKAFGNYPKENSDLLYIYETIPHEFKKYHDEKMDKSLPIVTSSFGPAVKTHYLVHRNHRPMAITKSNSKFNKAIGDDFSIFDSTFNLDDLKNQSFYIFGFQHGNVPKNKKNEYYEIFAIPPFYCKPEKEFISRKITKTIAIFTLFYCPGK